MARNRRGGEPASRAEPEPGSLVPLGEGPVAGVSAGVDQVTGEAFALKVYPGKVDRGVRSEVDAELSTLSPLHSRAPVLVANRIEEHDGRSALRMELCAQSLPELISSFGPLSVTDALALGESVATALAAAHACGVVHGSVTPGNVLFRPSGEAVLADFGVALRRAFPLDAELDDGSLSPETVRDGTMDERSDVYGIGAVLYLALTARTPHAGQLGDQPGQRLLRMLNSPPPELGRTDLPPGLDVLVAALLAKNPDARPVGAANVASRLGAMLGPSAPGEAGGGGAALSGAPSAAPTAAPRTTGRSTERGRRRARAESEAAFDDFAVPPESATDSRSAQRASSRSDTAFDDFGAVLPTHPQQPPQGRPPQAQIR